MEPAFPGQKLHPSHVADDVSSSPVDAQLSNTPRCFFDSSLLFRCMALLQIDRDELATNDPLLFYELQARCALCRSKERCIDDQAHEFDDATWDEWHEYCPNSATLARLGAAQSCGLAAQYFTSKKPR